MKPKKLILACRNMEKAQAAKSTIESATNLHDIEVHFLYLFFSLVFNTCIQGLAT